MGFTALNYKILNKVMKGQKVEQSDFVGCLKGFPIEVVQEIVNEQVRQGNKADV